MVVTWWIVAFLCSADDSRWSTQATQNYTYLQHTSFSFISMGFDWVFQLHCSSSRGIVSDNGDPAHNGTGNLL